MAAAGPAHTGEALQARLERRMRREWGATSVALLALCLALCLFAQPLGITRLDNTLYDFLANHQADRTAPDDIVIVGIDDDSLETIGYWPWRRALHARLLSQLRDARLVGLDFLLSDVNPAYPQDDALLAAAMQAHGRVVLPVMLDDARQRVVMPLPALARAALALGNINIEPDADGVIRQFEPLRQTPQGTDIAHLSVAMLETLAPDRLPVNGVPGTRLRIPFLGPPGHFHHIPYARVLDGSVPPQFFRDKTVLVGAWGSGLGDVFATPRSHAGEVMSGVEILANILQGGLSRHWVDSAALAPTIAGNLLPVLLVLIGCRILSPQRQLWLTTALMGLMLAACAVLLFRGHLWWSPLPGLIALVLSYPAWSWRSQQAALRHIDAELSLLTQADGAATAQNDAHSATRMASAWDQSLAHGVGQLHQALGNFRRAQQQQDETLRFLSHDMRAPLNSLLALTEHERRANPQQPKPAAALLDNIDHYAARTLKLVDDFIGLGRASAQALRQVPVDLCGLVLDCADDSWARARQKNITLGYEGLNREAWILADAELLGRALLNLIDNAIKYSAAGTRVRLVLTEAAPESWEICIIDQGRGMDATELAQIFTPFTRVATHMPANPGGSGLGLAFVHTVVQRHHAGISVHSQPGEGSRFCIRLRRHRFKS